MKQKSRTKKLSKANGLHSSTLVKAGVAAAVLIAAIYISATIVKPPAIALIRLSGAINDPTFVSGLMHAAKQNSTIKAVVLQIDSPGGEAAAVEELYLSVLDMRKSKPVVVSIDRLAASGAYYISVASNFVYAKPASSVGGIGVIASLPAPERIEENVLTSGPYKGGYSRSSFVIHIQEVAESFLNAVLDQRPKITLGRKDLAQGQIYLGLDALQHGLIDGVGSLQDAFNKAADLAGIANYDVVKLSPEIIITTRLALSINKTALEATNTVPVYHYLYLPGSPPSGSQ